MDDPASKSLNSLNFPIAFSQNISWERLNLHRHASEMCSYMSWRKKKALNRMFSQGLLFYNHAIKECSEKENQEKTMTALRVLWGIRPHNLTRAANPPWSFPTGQSVSSNALPLFPPKYQTKEHNMPITINEEVQTKNQKKKKAEVTNCFLPPRVFLHEQCLWRWADFSVHQAILILWC